MQEVFPMIPASSKPLWVIGGMALFLVALAGFFGFLAYSARHVQFEISANKLHIKGDIYGRTLAIEALNLEQAREIDLNEERSLQPRLRTNGTGLPGYQAGWFKLRNDEKALVFLTDRRRVVYIPTREGYALLLSVAAPKVFLNALLRAASAA